MTVAHPKLILLAVCLVALMSTAGVAMPYPILAPIFVHAPADGFNHFLGLPPKLLLGVALAANPLGILVGSMFIGALSDSLGRRRILLITLTLTLLGYLLTAWALDMRWYLLFVFSRFLTGLTEGNVAVARAIVADLHPQLERARSFAILNAVLYMGWLVGPMIGGFTLPFGEPVPFLIGAFTLLPCLAILLWVLPETGEAKGLQGRSLSHVVRQQHAFSLLRQDDLLAGMFWMQLLFALGVNAFYEFYPLWLVEFAHMGSSGIAWVTAGLCLVMALSSTALGRRGHGREPLLLARRNALLVGGGLLVLALMPSTPGLLLVVVLGWPLAIYNALLPAWCAEQFAHLGQGAVMGLLSTVFCISNVLVALLGGGLTLLDTRLTIALGGGMCLVAVWRLGKLARWPHLARQEA
ncbi:MFS transporter [Vogesella sp. LIG4]|uniref:MFS transporter n=1 Tax=Vogesella sp. LIG4 TaxID=1192162 RepID=UPI00081FFFC8|nr:MFS transporter [Vogesella sp. LIG4]SCK25985.1 Predicted arabinose efflux permease, MFS family [Vogesella sp. LIG4]